MNYLAPRAARATSLAVRTRTTATVLRLFVTDDILTRAELARVTGLSATTITNVVAELLRAGVVEELGPEVGAARDGAGRPRVALRLVPRARLTLGVHFGVGVVHVGLVDLRGGLVQVARLAHAAQEPAAQVLDRVSGAARALVAGSGAADRVLGVGVGASGLVDVRRGINRLAPRLGWRDVPIADLLAEQLGLPVWVDNNVRAMALAETLFGAGRGAASLAFVFVGRGLGAGLVMRGQLYHGSADGAGEVGHLTVSASHGLPCHCGNTGCLETLISRDALAEVAAQLGVQPRDGRACPSAEDLVQAARDGHPAAEAALREAGRHLGVGVAALVNVVNPELVVLGGLAADAADLLLPVVRDTVHTRAFPFLGSAVEIVPTALGPDIGVIGAGALAMDRFYADAREVGGHGWSAAPALRRRHHGRPAGRPPGAELHPAEVQTGAVGGTTYREGGVPPATYARAATAPHRSR